MKNTIIICLAVVGVLLTLNSCEDYLVETNPNELSSDLYWRDLNDCESGLIAIFNQLRAPELVNLRIDPCKAEVGIPTERKRTAEPTGTYYQRTYNSGSGDVTDKWRILYTGIYRANQVIEGLEGVATDTLTNEENAERWRHIMGQARFLRGLFHYWAYITYNSGSVIIVDKTPGTDEADYYRPLSTSEEVSTFFREDLKEAYNLLPESWVEDGPELSNGRPTKGTAAAYLGQGYLYEAKYNEGIGVSGDVNFETAKSYLEKVMAFNYELIDYQPDGTLCTTQDELNQESIFEIMYDNTTKSSETSTQENTSTWAAYYSVGSHGAYTTIIPSYWTVLAYKNDPMDLTDERNHILDENGNFVRYRGNPGNSDPSHVKRINLRLSLSIAIPEDEDKLYYGSKMAERPTNNIYPGAFRKFANWDITTTEDEVENRSGINHRLMRLSDVYLMYAECLIEGGSNDAGVDMALRYINRVRRRAALELLGSSTNPSGEYPMAQHNELAYTASELMKHIMYIERPLELCLEGYSLRSMDLRRWDIMKARFEELAQKSYYFNSPAYQYTNDKGELVNAKSYVVNAGEHPTTPTSTNMEFITPAANHIEAIHNYYPIPVNETGTNPNVQ